MGYVARGVPGGRTLPLLACAALVLGCGAAGTGSERVVSLGTLSPRAKVRRTVPLTNTSGRDVVITGVGTSCDCLTASVPLGPLPAGATVNADVTVDLANDPDFRGNLSLQVVVRTQPPDMFTIQIDVTVVGDER